MKKTSLPEDQNKTIVRLERQLSRERQVRKDAERIAEASTARLYREQMKLHAVSQVAAQAYVNDGLHVRKASESTLTASTCQGLQDARPLELVIDERVESTLP